VKKPLIRRKSSTSVNHLDCCVVARRRDVQQERLALVVQVQLKTNSTISSTLAVVLAKASQLTSPALLCNLMLQRKHWTHLDRRHPVNCPRRFLSMSFQTRLDPINRQSQLVHLLHFDRSRGCRLPNPHASFHILTLCQRALEPVRHSTTSQR
jgi:hypothetical protein